MHLKIMCIHHQDTWWSEIEHYGAPHTGPIEIHRLTPTIGGTHKVIPHHIMQKFEDSVACPVCHKVVAWDIFHKHWKHAKGHATSQNPIPPSSIPPKARTLLLHLRSIEKFGNNACTSMTDFKINRPGQRTLLGNHYIHPQSAARSALKAQ
jgi:hypothetical protein